MLLDLIDKAGNLFDLPGSMVRDALTLNNPLDQLLTPLSSDNRMDGRDVLEKWGMLGPNTEGLDVGDVAGTAAGIALDPLTWVSGAGVMKLLGRGAKSAKAGTGTKAAQALLEAPTQSRALVPYRSPLQSVLRGPTSPMTPLDADPFAIMREAMGQPKPAALPAPAPVFYSRLRRAIEQLPDPEKGLKSQSVLNMLKKAPEGISMDEFKWSGLPQQLEHTPIVSKAILMDALDDMPVGINPIVQQPPQLRYEGPSYTHKQLSDVYVQSAGRGNTRVSPLTGAPLYGVLERSDYTQALRRMLFSMREDGLSFEDAMKLHGNKNLEQLTGGKIVDDSPFPPSQWDSFVMPKGKDYRETLLQEQHTPLDFNHEDVYTGGHWGQPNIGAHLRTTTRDLKGVGPTHFIDEIQSDWHQDGRKYGYGLTERDYQSARDETDRIITGTIRNELRKHGIDAEGEDVIGAWSRFLDEHESLRGKSGYDFLSPSDRARVDELDKITDKFEAAVGNGGVIPPHSPFANNWQDVALKKALYDAAAQNSPGIGWSVGDDIQGIVGGNLKGQRQFYDREIENRLRKILASKGQADSRASVAPLTGLEDAPVSGGHYIPIDPQTRARILAEGFPLLSLPFLAAFGLTGGEQRGVQ